MDKIQTSITKNVEELFNLSETQHEYILGQYKQSLDTIRGFIAQVYMKYSVDGILSYGEMIKYNRLHSLVEQFRTELKGLGSLELKNMNLNLDQLYSQSYYSHAFVIETGIQASISFALLNPKFVKEAVIYNWSGVPFSERIWANQDQMLRILRTHLTQSIILGEDISKISKRMAKTLDTSAFNSQRLMRTESARVISDAQTKLYKDSGVVERVKWSATLDSKTSEICQGRDGKIWSINDDYPTPPAHPNCRSCLIPLVANQVINQRIDNETKKFIDYQTYEEWYKAKVN